MTVYAIYKVFEGETNKGYYWGKYTDPIKLAYACFRLAEVVYDIKIVTYDNWDDIKPEIEW